MELVKDLVSNHLSFLLPVFVVVLVVVVGILVFTFGFRSAEQPPFDKLTIDDRKQAGKKRKIKDKKTSANGHVSTGESKSEKSPVKESKRSPAKENNTEAKKVAEKNKKNETIKNRLVEDTKSSKKNIKKLLSEKPVDFDEGDWETVPSKADKKKKPDQSPAKKENGNKKSKKAAEIEKLVKEVVNKELREKEIVKEEEPIKVEEVVVVEEKKEKVEKKKEKKAKKEEKAPVIEEKVINKAPQKESGGVVYDELGDVWTEAKAAKKSKKKVRRDN